MELSDITCQACGEAGIFFFKHKDKLVIVCVNCDAEMVIEEKDV